ncbi:lysylphosphatidylglycerol synthase transmembrane domain-containing protein, partial [Bacteroidota bacterium]
LIFLLIGIALFWYAYRDMDFSGIQGVLNELNYSWLLLSLLFAFVNLYIRAIRWKKLILPLNYKPKTYNLFISIFVLYLTNLIIPRGGEVTRCGVITRYEKVPFTKLLGTVFIERLSDFLAFAVIMIVVLIWQFPFIKDLLTSSELEMDFSGLKSKSMITGIAIILLGILFFILRRYGFFKKIKAKLVKIKDDFLEGIKVITKMEGMWIYIFQTFLIMGLWLLMFWVIFFAYAPTEHLTVKVAVFTYALGTLAYLLPIQAGIGVWHLIVIQCLLLFGIDKESGMMFALIAHTFSNIIYLVFGAIGLVLLPIINNNNNSPVLDANIRSL